MAMEERKLQVEEKRVSTMLQLKEDQKEDAESHVIKIINTGNDAQTSPKIYSSKMADAMNMVEVGAGDYKLIVRTKLAMEEEFANHRRKKCVLWRKVVEKIKEQKPDFTLNKDQVTRKFLNFLTTYKRIKSRNKESGRKATTWEFYEDFDEVYGIRHSVFPPVANLISSIEPTGTPEPSPEPTECAEEVEPPSNKSRGSQTEILAYLKKESEKEQKRHEELMAMEERKLQVEEKRVSTMLQLKEDQKDDAESHVLKVVNIAYDAQTSPKMHSIKMADAMDEVEVGAGDYKLIVRTRLDMEEKFANVRRKKCVLWRKVVEKIKEQKPNFTLNKDQVNRKFLNFLTTYKRIKSRNKESGRKATTWEFYEDFDEVYGIRHSVVPPVANLISSIEPTGTPEPSPEPTECAEEVEPPSNKSRGSQTEILAYLKKESEKEQKRHEELMAMEERKLQVEEKRVSTMLQLKEVLEITIGIK